MDKKLKENLNKALNRGKDALENLRKITKKITKEIIKESKDQGEDVKKSAGNFFKEIVNALGELGKDTFEYLKAASIGFKEGLKESSAKDNNLLKELNSAMLDSLKNLGEAGIYVTKETAKNLFSIVENMLKKDKGDDSKDKNNDEKDDDAGI